MAYFNEKLYLTISSIDDISLFRRIDNHIIRYRLNTTEYESNFNTISEDILGEFSVTIDKWDIIYLVYQDTSFNLILLLLDGDEIKSIKLTEDPIPEIYYLNISMCEGIPHIFYFVSTSKGDGKYKLYHHNYDGRYWNTYIVDDIRVGKLLNPMKVFNRDGKLIIAYYNGEEYGQIYIKEYDFNRKKWSERKQLTKSQQSRLYIDLILKDNMVHIAYCQHMYGNLVVVYERFLYDDGIVKRDILRKLSNPENPQHPTIIYYGGRLWICWIEYENVMSCYSQDMGSTWSPIYMWQKSKGMDIVRYEYHGKLPGDIILDSSFGNIGQEIGLIGFGSTIDTIEIPSKLE